MSGGKTQEPGTTSADFPVFIKGIIHARPKGYRFQPPGVWHGETGGEGAMPDSHEPFQFY